MSFYCPYASVVQGTKYHLNGISLLVCVCLSTRFNFWTDRDICRKIFWANAETFLKIDCILTCLIF